MVNRSKPVGCKCGGGLIRTGTAGREQNRSETTSAPCVTSNCKTGGPQFVKWF